MPLGDNAAANISKANDRFLSALDDYVQVLTGDRTTFHLKLWSGGSQTGPRAWHVAIPEDWAPTSENINALPPPLLDYVRRIELDAMRGA